MIIISGLYLYFLDFLLTSCHELVGRLWDPVRPSETTHSRFVRESVASTQLLTNLIWQPFYACYLLRSIKTPTSRATYIGSTPHPPRRIRQHNGEITAGAWKTKKGR